MKRFLPLLLALLLALQVTACAQSVTVTHAEADRLELALDGVPESTLVTAVYLGGQMVDCAASAVLTGMTAVEVQFHSAIPEGSTLKSFVLGQNAKPLLPASELGRPDARHSNILVAYFSYTNHTEAVAQEIANATDGDLFEIVPAKAYPSNTSNYYDSSTRAYQEQNDPSARPAIAANCSVSDWDNYDVIFLGYPIWYGAPPKIIYTFLESYDFSGKTVVAFSTSGSSGHSDSALRPLAPGADWRAGHRFAIGADQAAVDAWLDALGLPTQEEDTMETLTLSFNGHSYTATLADDPSAEEFAQLIRGKGGSMTVHMNDYGGWEKVGPLGQALTRHDVQTTTQAGDFVLYSGDQIVLFYGSNSWSYTRLGRVDDPSGLREALGAGNVDVTFRLTDR